VLGRGRDLRKELGGGLRRELGGGGVGAGGREDDAAGDGGDGHARHGPPEGRGPEEAVVGHVSSLRLFG
jgi:hypothetical protein